MLDNLYRVFQAPSPVNYAEVHLILEPGIRHPPTPIGSNIVYNSDQQSQRKRNLLQPEHVRRGSSYCARDGKIRMPGGNGRTAAKCWEHYIMVAANLSRHQEGSIVKTKFGLGHRLRYRRFASRNPTQIDIAATGSAGFSGEEKCFRNMCGVFHTGVVSPL